MKRSDFEKFNNIIVWVDNNEEWNYLLINKNDKKLYIQTSKNEFQPIEQFKIIKSLVM